MVESKGNVLLLSDDEFNKYQQSMKELEDKIQKEAQARLLAYNISKNESISRKMSLMDIDNPYLENESKVKQAEQLLLEQEKGFYSNVLKSFGMDGAISDQGEINIHINSKKQFQNYKEQRESIKNLQSKKNQRQKVNHRKAKTFTQMQDELLNIHKKKIKQVQQKLNMNVARWSIFTNVLTFQLQRKQQFHSLLAKAIKQTGVIQKVEQEDSVEILEAVNEDEIQRAKQELEAIKKEQTKRNHEIQEGIKINIRNSIVDNNLSKQFDKQTRQSIYNFKTQLIQQKKKEIIEKNQLISKPIYVQERKINHSFSSDDSEQQRKKSPFDNQNYNNTVNFNNQYSTKQHDLPNDIKQNKKLNFTNSAQRINQVYLNNTARNLNQKIHLQRNTKSAYEQKRQNLKMKQASNQKLNSAKSQRNFKIEQNALTQDQKVFVTQENCQSQFNHRLANQVDNERFVASTRQPSRVLSPVSINNSLEDDKENKLQKMFNQANKKSIQQFQVKLDATSKENKSKYQQLFQQKPNANSIPKLGQMQKQENQQNTIGAHYTKKIQLKRVLDEKNQKLLALQELQELKKQYEQMLQYNFRVPKFISQTDSEQTNLADKSSFSKNFIFQLILSITARSTFFGHLLSLKFIKQQLLISTQFARSSQHINYKLYEFNRNFLLSNISELLYRVNIIGINIKQKLILSDSHKHVILILYSVQFLFIIIIFKYFVTKIQQKFNFISKNIKLN